eukprot:gene12923-13049_t
MSDHSLSMSLWSLATLGISNAASHAFVQAAARRLRNPSVSFDVLGSQSVANSLWAVAKLGHHDQRLLEKGTTWLAKNLNRCKMQEVLNILWAAGAARHRPMVLGTIAKHVASQAQVLKPADVASLFHVLGIFGFDFVVDLELQASGQRLVAVQILDEHSTDHQGNKLASVLWEEDVLRRNGYDDIFWLRVSELKKIPVERRVRYFVDILRKLGVNPQERLVAAAEKAWAVGAAGGEAAEAKGMTTSSGDGQHGMGL